MTKVAALEVPKMGIPIAKPTPKFWLGAWKAPPHNKTNDPTRWKKTAAVRSYERP